MLKIRYPRKIYAIQHNQTKRIYIGSTFDLENRYLNHMYALRSGKHAVEDMQIDFDEYGEDYSLFVLDEIKEFSERHKEYEQMKRFKSHIRGIGYNYNDVSCKRAECKNKIPYKEGIPTTNICEYME